jgi:lipopolysaccharide/colanic/teichoic acid biosynthesis glycosyltransferase
MIAFNDSYIDSDQGSSVALAPAPITRRRPATQRIARITPPRQSRKVPRKAQTKIVSLALENLNKGHEIVLPEGNRSRSYLLAKRAFDVVGGLALVVLLSPIMLVTFATLAVTTKGNPLFFQERIGLCGRRFRMIKFRTMRLGAESERGELLAMNEMDGPVFKLSDDPRTTALGRFLRKWSIDELPQLINVLLGSMSLVGPRPLPTREQREIRGWHRRRLSMKPGITGLWQVSGRNELSFEEWMKLDLRYVDEWSLKLDALILLRTIPAVLGRRGAR